VIPSGKVDELHAVAHAGLGEDPVDMVLDGLQGDEEGVSDLAVAFSCPDFPDDFGFAA
jgi:hypothetical protein